MSQDMPDATMPQGAVTTDRGCPIPAYLCQCGCGQMLQGRQRRFASTACRCRVWDSLHPRVNRGPAGPREGTLKALILGCLGDGEWHTEQQIADDIRAFSHSVGARLSELRRASHPIEVRRVGRLKQYRLR